MSIRRLGKGGGNIEQKLTREFVHLTAKQNLSLYTLILNGILIKILEDDDVTSGGLRGLRNLGSLSRTRGGLRRRL